MRCVYLDIGMSKTKISQDEGLTARIDHFGAVFSQLTLATSEDSGLVVNYRFLYMFTLPYVL